MDGDDDPDAVFLDWKTGLSVFRESSGGRLLLLPGFPVTTPAAMTVADIDANGRFDIIALERSGAIKAISFDAGMWSARQIATWPDCRADGYERLIAADFDNNGAIDLIVTSARESRMWLGTKRVSCKLLMGCHA